MLANICGQHKAVCGSVIQLAVALKMNLAVFAIADGMRRNGRQLITDYMQYLTVAAHIITRIVRERYNRLVRKTTPFIVVYNFGGKLSSINN